MKKFIYYQAKASSFLILLLVGCSNHIDILKMNTNEEENLINSTFEEETKKTGSVKKIHPYVNKHLSNEVKLKKTRETNDRTKKAESLSEQATHSKQLLRNAYKNKFKNPKFEKELHNLMEKYEITKDFENSKEVIHINNQEEKLRNLNATNKQYIENQEILRERVEILEKENKKLQSGSSKTYDYETEGYFNDFNLIQNYENINSFSPNRLNTLESIEEEEEESSRRNYSPEIKKLFEHNTFNTNYLESLFEKIEKLTNEIDYLKGNNEKNNKKIKNIDHLEKELDRANENINSILDLINDLKISNDEDKKNESTYSSVVKPRIEKKSSLKISISEDEKYKSETKIIHLTPKSNKSSFKSLCTSNNAENDLEKYLLESRENSDKFDSLKDIKKHPDTPIEKFYFKDSSVKYHSVDNKHSKNEGFSKPMSSTTTYITSQHIPSFTGSRITNENPHSLYPNNHRIYTNTNIEPNKNNIFLNFTAPQKNNRTNKNNPRKEKLKKPIEITLASIKKTNMTPPKNERKSENFGVPNVNTFIICSNNTRIGN